MGELPLCVQQRRGVFLRISKRLRKGLDRAAGIVYPALQNGNLATLPVLERQCGLLDGGIGIAFSARAVNPSPANPERAYPNALGSFLEYLEPE